MSKLAKFRSLELALVRATAERTKKALQEELNAAFLELDVDTQNLIIQEVMDRYTEANENLSKALQDLESAIKNIKGGS